MQTEQLFSAKNLYFYPDLESFIAHIKKISGTTKHKPILPEIHYNIAALELPSRKTKYTFYKSI